MTYTETVTLEKLTCGHCAGVFALNASFLNHARNNRGGYNCPYCQTPWSWFESEADRLRKQIEQKQRELSAVKCELLHAQNVACDERKARQGAEKKLRRVNAGVCPCCNRTFQNLARHMATKHKGKP